MASGIVDELVNRIKESVTNITDDFEIILVEDGSPDNSWEEIESNCKKDKRVKGIKLSRNFGQQLALTAGLSFAKGAYVVVIDCDLQDDPKYIPELYKKVKEGYEIVFAKKDERKHDFFKDFMSLLFYKFLSLISDYEMDPTIGSYSILSRKTVDSFLKFKEYRKGYLITLKLLGYKNSYISTDHKDRYLGESSYSFISLIKHAIRITISYSDKLLLFSIYVGILFFTFSLIGIVYLLCQYFFIGKQEGWTSLMVMLCLIGGLIMLSLGIIGLYISAIFDQVKNRPPFLVDKTLNYE